MFTAPPPSLMVTQNCNRNPLCFEQTPQPEEKARGKDRRSAKTGVRAGGGAGGRAPTSTVVGEPVESGPDPMTYALQQVRKELWALLCHRIFLFLFIVCVCLCAERLLSAAAAD